MTFQARSPRSFECTESVAAPKKSRRSANTIDSEDENEDNAAAPVPSNTTVEAAAAEDMPRTKKQKTSSHEDPASEWATWKKGENVPYAFLATVNSDSCFLISAKSNAGLGF